MCTRTHTYMHTCMHMHPPAHGAPPGPIDISPYPQGPGSQSCASCHGATGSGGHNPALAAGTSVVPSRCPQMTPSRHCQFPSPGWRRRSRGGDRMARGSRAPVPPWHSHARVGHATVPRRIPIVPRGGRSGVDSGLPARLPRSPPPPRSLLVDLAALPALADMRLRKRLCRGPPKNVRTGSGGSRSLPVGHSRDPAGCGQRWAYPACLSFPSRVGGFGG